MAPKLPLPRGWKRRVRSSVLHILALSHYTLTALLAKAALSKNRQVRLHVPLERKETCQHQRQRGDDPGNRATPVDWRKRLSSREPVSQHHTP